MDRPLLFGVAPCPIWISHNSKRLLASNLSDIKMRFWHARDEDVNSDSSWVKKWRTKAKSACFTQILLFELLKLTVVISIQQLRTSIFSHNTDDVIVCRLLPASSVAVFLDFWKINQATLYLNLFFLTVNYMQTIKNIMWFGFSQSIIEIFVKNDSIPSTFKNFFADFPA